ncbi:hypothetical protein AVEN_97410-1 [Araneus ventricosus]|uniref:RNase H type-1 domain-containing protein n=1 Tax=Araneus ventricosus TaxID=182803 RepID=A0A4Y2W6F3_ARAVE|nr:hypothetical protein AVEN_97410-1 [Araneus ventricosus]
MEDKTGSAFCVMEEDTTKYEWIAQLSSFNTVFQAELLAIQEACLWASKTNQQIKGLIKFVFFIFDRVSNDSSCLRSLRYHYPGILCEIQDPIPCDYSYPYKKIDDTCNNPHISRFGMVNQCFERFIPAFVKVQKRESTTVFP